MEKYTNSYANTTVARHFFKPSYVTKIFGIY